MRIVIKICGFKLLKHYFAPVTVPVVYLFDLLVEFFSWNIIVTVYIIEWELKIYNKEL